MALGSNHVTATTSDVMAPNVWASEVLRATESNLVLVPLVKHYDRDIKSYGQTVEIPNLSNLTANAKSANTAVTLNGPTETKTTITIDEHWEASVLIEDIADAQAKYDLVNEYRQKAGYAIAEKMDNFVATEMADNLTQEVGSYGTVLSYDNLRAGKLLLDEAKAPMDNRYLVVTAQGLSELLDVDEFTRSDFVGNSDSNSPFKNGKVGVVLGFEVYMSQNLDIDAGTPEEHDHLMFHEEAFAIAVQKQPTVEMQRKTEYLGDLVVCSALWGGTILRDAFGVVVKS